MILINSKSLEILGSYILLANTPSYLFRHYSNDQNVIDYSFEQSTEELFALLNTLIDDISSDIEKLIPIYVIIFSLFKKPINEILPLFENVRYKEIRWFEQFCEIYKSNLMPETVATFNLPTKIVPLLSLSTLGSSSSSSVAQHKPHINIVKE